MATANDGIDVQIRDAILADLNATARAWSLPFRAAASWLPVYDVAAGDLKALRVAVVPLTLPMEDRLGRTGLQAQEYEFAIDLQALVNVAPNASTTDLDALTALAGAIHDRYRRDPSGSGVLSFTLAGGATAVVMRATRPEIYDVELLNVQHIWETVILPVVRVHR